MVWVGCSLQQGVDQLLEVGWVDYLNGLFKSYVYLLFSFIYFIYNVMMFLVIMFFVVEVFLVWYGIDYGFGYFMFFYYIVVDCDDLCIFIGYYY